MLVGNVPASDLKMTAIMTNSRNGPRASKSPSAFPGGWTGACRDPKGSKLTRWCQGPSVVTLSLYSTAQRAGDSYYQQVTVAVLNAGQMAIQGVVVIQLGEGGGNRVRLRSPDDKRTLGTMCHSMQPWCETPEAAGEAGFFSGCCRGSLPVKLPASSSSFMSYQCCSPFTLCLLPLPPVYSVRTAVLGQTSSAAPAATSTNLKVGRAGICFVLV